VKASTDFLLALTGIHPRSEKTIQATQDWERHRISIGSLRRQFREDVRELVNLQLDLAYDYVSDGQLTSVWQDAFTPFASGVRGLKKGPLVRWFNTNTFYYVPVVEGPISVDGSSAGRLVETEELGGAPSKVVLPDPLTFIESSDDRHYGDRAKLVFAYCDHVLSPLLKALHGIGVQYVQFSAPALVARFRGERWGTDALSPVAEGLRGALKGTGLRAGYQTFFGDAERYLEFLLDSVPTDDVGFDLTETDPSKIGRTSKGIVAGVANARSSFVEQPADLLTKLNALRDKTKTLTLAPSSDLRYVPRPVADAKLRSLAEARRKLR